MRMLVATMLTLFSGVSLALQTDANEIAHFKADQVTFNNQSNTTIYAGHVQMDQGTTHLSANKIVVYKDADGSMRKAIATGTAATQAHYTTLPDNQKNPMDAFGDTIDYDPKKRVAIVIGNGTVIQAMNSIKGPYIIYDIVKQTMTSIPSSEIKGGEKSELILQPKDLPGADKK